MLRKETTWPLFGSWCGRTISVLINTTLLAFRGFAHDPQGVLAAIQRLALVGIKLDLNVSILELGIASLAHADGGRGLFHNPQFALRHDSSLAHRAGRA